MNTRTCPYCEEEKDTRGYAIHIIRCKEKVKRASMEKRYASQIANMTPETAERFLRKAGGLR